MTKTAKCTACGGPMIAMYRRLYCEACQAKRDLPKLIKAKPRTCGCGRTFFPFRKNHTSCARCSLKVQRPEQYPQCKVCHEHWRPAPGMDPGRICTVCVTSSDKTRRRYMLALQEG